jgi:hypothetical protein
MDAAIIASPATLFHGPLSEGQTVGGLALVKEMTSASMGQDVFMVGRRWLGGKQSTAILKKGIISTVTTDLPGYKGHAIILGDTMSSIGMTGGLVFTERGRASE